MKSFGKYLKKKNYLEPNRLLSCKCLVNLTLIPKLFSKDIGPDDNIQAFIGLKAGLISIWPAMA